MTIKESVEQLENLIEAWQLDEADLNQTDIDAIKHTLKENKTLKQQLDYLRSGEYYNQLRFENEMLQNVVDTNGVPSEVYDYIDCAHRNTELLGKRQELINYLKEKMNKIENKLILKYQKQYELGKIQGSYKVYKEILSKIEKR